MDQLKILDILNENKDLPFVMRIMNPGYPSLYNRDGSESTHSMAFGEFNGKYIVYPTVVYDEEVMSRLGPDTAFGRAIRMGDYIEFEEATDAYEFSREYKKLFPFFEKKEDGAKDVVFPKKKTIWKDMNTGPGTLSGDSMSGANDGN